MTEKDKNQNNFQFEISMSVLNHLGRNLYRSFATILGEAISNSWDADAKNVWIYVDKSENRFFIKDDGVGMSANDFQNKFLKIGYTKRKISTISQGGRAYIGRKGIGKLALLSCADRISIISKVENESYIGGVIDNSDLEKAIKDDVKPDEYDLEMPDMATFTKYTKGHKRGTIIYFEGIRDGIKNSLKFMKKSIALYFRFSLLDKSFNIYLNDEKITQESLHDLADTTEFLWNINSIDDPYVKKMLNKLKEPEKNILMSSSIKGFIASVSRPRDLNIISADERVGVNLFVNGRIRESDILKHIPTARVAESYLYGQIHYDDLDSGEDRFTSSREGVIADDPKYKNFLKNLRKKILEIVVDWDKLRIKNREDGDSENERMSRKDRKSGELFNAVSKEYSLPKSSKNKNKVDGWVGELADDAKFNFGSYAECFISENLIRKFVIDKKLKLSPQAKTKAGEWKTVEAESKAKGNISIKIRRVNNDLSYLSMDDLAYLVDKKDPIKEACLARDAKEYKPIRDAVAHTSLLTQLAKDKLSSVYENIKARVKTLLK